MAMSILNSTPENFLLKSSNAMTETPCMLSFSLKLVVSAEVLSFTVKSLGGMMQDAKLYAEIPQLFALVGVTFIVGLILETAVGVLASLAERKVK